MIAWRRDWKSMGGSQSESRSDTRWFWWMMTRLFSCSYRWHEFWQEWRACGRIRHYEFGWKRSGFRAKRPRHWEWSVRSFLVLMWELVHFVSASVSLHCCRSRDSVWRHFSGPEQENMVATNRWLCRPCWSMFVLLFCENFGVVFDKQLSVCLRRNWQS